MTTLILWRQPYPYDSNEVSILPKSLLLNTIRLGLRFQQGNFERAHSVHMSVDKIWIPSCHQETRHRNAKQPFKASSAGSSWVTITSVSTDSKPRLITTPARYPLPTARCPHPSLWIWYSPWLSCTLLKLFLWSRENSMDQFCFRGQDSLQYILADRNLKNPGWFALELFLSPAPLPP